MSTLPKHTKMIFVVGNSRSGTTMLGRILGRSEHIFTLNELHFFEQIWQPKVPLARIDQADTVNYIARLIAIQRGGYFVRPDIKKYVDEAAEVVTNQSDYWTMPDVYAAFVSYEAEKSGKQIPCDKTPRNLYFIQKILGFYSNVFVVNIIRDPRAVLYSQKNRWKRRIYSRGRVPLFQQLRARINYHPITISLLWKSGLRAYEEFRNHPRLLSLRFEELVTEPEDEIQRICHFLNVGYHAEMLAVPQVGSSHKPDSHQALGINSEVADQWKHAGLSDTEIWLCQKFTRALMENYGYEEIHVSPNVLILLASIVTWVFQLGLVLLLNLGRTRNPFKAGLRRFQFSRGQSV